MMETKQTDPQVISEFRQRRTRQLMATVPIVAAVIFLFKTENAGSVGLFGIPSSVVIPICVAIVFAGLVFSFFNWRCPGCKSHLGKAISPKFCYKCGIKLQD